MPAIKAKIRPTGSAQRKGKAYAMRRLGLFVTVCLLAGGIAAAPQASKKAGALRCTLTGKVIESCCCEQRQDGLYCPLAKKTTQTCCCVSAAAKAKKK